MDKVRELNAKLGDKVQPYQELSQGKQSIVNENLFYFILIGLGHLVVTIITSSPSTDSVGTVSVNPIVALGILVLSILIYIGISSWSVSLYRATSELVANKGIAILKTSFLPDFTKDFFILGLKYFVSSGILGVLVGLLLLVPLIIIGMVVGLALGSLLVGSAEFGVAGLIYGGALGVIGAVFVVLLAILALIVFIMPLILPITTLYMYYGEHIGVLEAVGLSFKLGFKNYKLLLVTSFKVIGLNFLGLLAFGIGIVYTAPIGMLIEIDAVSSILGISLAEGKTFKDNGVRVVDVSDESPSVVSDDGLDNEDVTVVNVDDNEVEDIE